MKFVAEDPKLLNARGPEGSTPFMYAVLYTGAPTLERLLKQGADVNKRNDANATALMWAATDLEKTRLLVAHGADVNARSSDMRTPLMIAARRPGNSAGVKLLLDRGANPNPNPHPAAESSPLIEAATAGDAASVELLLGHGAEVKGRRTRWRSRAAYLVRCAKCAALVMAKGLSKEDYTVALTNTAVLGDVERRPAELLDRGADVKAVDPLGRTRADVRGRIRSASLRCGQAARRTRGRHQRHGFAQVERRFRDSPCSTSRDCMGKRRSSSGWSNPGPRVRHVSCAGSQGAPREHHPERDPGKSSA